MNKSLKIAVLFGGDSAEAEVSRVSAQGVITALKENYADVTAIELVRGFDRELAVLNPDVVFPVLHGPPGEDGTLQGFLEMLGYPYVGSDVHGSSTAMNKILAKHVFRHANLPVIEQTTVNRRDGIASAVAKIQQDLGDYVVVKPAGQGSALGVTLVSNSNELHAAVEKSFALDENLLIERRLNGREMTVGVIDTDDGCFAFPVIEITTPDNSWYDYEHRYTKGLSEHLMPADLSAEQTRRLQQIAVTAHQQLGCRDLSRADLIVLNDEQEFILEVNTLPGMTPTSLYPDGARGFGMDFPALVSHLIERAWQRRK
ncbi:MAG: D-alanine--D-alanine ligase [Pseudomonadales bacterium]|nr:D-alanine--D-alanine ligase [Pseudomonadales bacterium]